MKGARPQRSIQGKPTWFPGSRQVSIDSRLRVTMLPLLRRYDADQNHLRFAGSLYAVRLAGSRRRMQRSLDSRVVYLSIGNSNRAREKASFRQAFNDTRRGQAFE